MAVVLGVTVMRTTIVLTGWKVAGDCCCRRCDDNGLGCGSYVDGLWVPVTEALGR